MDVSIIMPLYNPDEKLLKEIEKSIKEQDFEGRIKVIKVKEGLGLADSLNFGIKKAKTEIVVSLHQDCLPASKDWLGKLVEPLKKKEVVAAVSKVELPCEFWKEFDNFAKVMSVKELKIITPLMDEKGCAYKKSAIEKVGFFDGKTFRTAGEDFDMWIKLKKNGEIAYPNCKIFHYHRHTFENRIKKEYQLSEGFGVLTRIYWKEIPNWKTGLAKSIPIFGWPLFLFNFPFLRMGILNGLVWIPLSLGMNFIYCVGFWRGFWKREQRV